MTVRAVEGKKPYTGGKAITVDENKVISLNLRDENNLIIYDEGDDEIYVDLQLPAGIRPNYAFPVGITTGRVLVADDWDVTGTIIVAKTTSGDVIKLLYGDDGTLWMDNGTGLFKQIYFKADVDQIITTLTTYINTELAKKQNGVSSTTAPTNPQPGDLWYNTSTNEIKVWKGTDWEELGGGSGDVQVSTDTGNLLSTGVKLWLGDKADFDNLGTLDTNTIYAPITGMGGGGGYTPGANTIAYYPLTSTTLGNDQSGNNFNLTNGGGVTFGTYGGVDCGYFTTKNCLKTSTGNILNNGSSTFTWLARMRFIDAGTGYPRIFTCSSQSNGLLVMQKDTLLVIWNSGINSGITYQTGGWHLYAITGNYSTGEFTGYVDTTSSSWTGNGSSYGSGLCIGGTNSTGTDIFNGYMSNIIFENKIRTAEEISAYYNATKATYGIS